MGYYLKLNTCKLYIARSFQVNSPNFTAPLMVTPADFMKVCSSEYTINYRKFLDISKTL